MGKLQQVLALAPLWVAASSASAIAVDEATYPGAGGDYNNLLSPPQIVAQVFDLGAGANTFRGRFGTPADQGDTFIIALAPTQTLTAIRVTFATNADAFNPVAINQASHLVFDLTSSGSATPLVDIALTGTPSSAVQFGSGPLLIGPGQYNTTVLTEVLALNDSGLVGYEVAFDVTAVPEPAAAALMLAGLAVLGVSIRRRC